MYKFRKGQRFYNWKVLEKDRYYKKINGRNYAYIKCMDVRCGTVRFITPSGLVNGLTKGHIKHNKGNEGWSTRTKNKHLPKHVSYYPLGNKKYRVCKKIEGKVLTIGYYKTLTKAKQVAQSENL